MNAALELDVELLAHQLDIATDTTSKYLVMEGGLGSGKTVALIVKMLALAWANPGVAGLVVEPTHDLIGSILLPTFEELLGLWQVPWEHRSQWRGRQSVAILWPGTEHEVIVYLRSGDKPARITGFKVGWFLVDEHDLQKPGVWRRCISRRRDRRAKVSQGCAFGTPEPGFGETYELFHKSPAPGTRLITGVSTRTNVFVAKDFADDLAATHPDELERVMSGKRMAKHGLVYSAFGPTHKRTCDNRLEGQLVIGADFNVSKMHWVLGRIVGEELHVWGELVGENTNTFEQTDEAIRMLSSLFTDPWGQAIPAQHIARRFRVYADPSGGARRSSAPESDLAIMRRAGFLVEDFGGPPAVEDRIASVQDRLRKRYLLVDPQGAPELVRCLETQGYGRDGKPDKDIDRGLDHGPDALGYVVAGHPSWMIHAPRGNSRAWK